MDSGTKLGHYEILSLLGKGGMGEVWRAKDAKLGREVAIKTLPEEFAKDADRLARFEREARLLASLNHPSIAVIHGFEEDKGTHFLVLELVEGDTLGDKLKRGPIPIKESLELALQIAEALEAAHEKGVIHRDLKPANVKVTPKGKVKVLDFGLAKAFGRDQSGVNLSNAPTLSMFATQQGMLLGTPAHMAPEQAKGEPVDGRADVFALGCVLYEMLAGRRAFEGGNVAEILSRVLERQPDFTRLPPGLPPLIRQLLGLCFEKNPRNRRQGAGDVRIDLEQALSQQILPVPAVTDGRWGPTRLVGIGSAVVLIALLGIPAFIHFREVPPREMRVEVTTPPTELPLHFALSPDGEHITFVAQPSTDAPEVLYLRTLAETEAQPIRGTEGARYPFWSPDSRSIGFFASGQLWRIDVITGGLAESLATAPNPLGGTWSEDGQILYTPESTSPLLTVSVSDSGSEPVAFTQLDSPRQQNHRFPSFLPDGLQFLFYVTGDREVTGIYLGSLDGGTPKRLTPAESAGVFLAPDRVVFVQGGALIARRFDLARGELTGDPETLAPSVGSDGTGFLGFSASASGVLAYRAVSGNPERRLTWFDRDGNELDQMEFFNGPELSPDDRYLAGERTIDGNREVVRVELDRGAVTRLTDNSNTDGYPVWCPDAQQLVFESNRNGTFGLWLGSSSRLGEEDVLLDTAAHEIPIDCSRDGRFVLYRRTDENFVSADLLVLPMMGEVQDPIEVAADPRSEEGMGVFSPDGRWIAYDTDQSGRSEVTVVRFPELDLQYPVSTNGGFAPRWTTDGQINFVALDGWMMAVEVSTTDSTFEAELPEPLFRTQMGVDGQTFNSFNHPYAVASDGRFLIPTVQEALEDDLLLPVTLVINWQP